MPLADLTKLQPVSDYLLGTTLYEAIEEVVRRQELPTERVAEFFDLIDAVVEGQIGPDHVPELVGEAFGIDAEKAKAVGRDVVGYCLLPLELYMTTVVSALESLGGKVSDYPSFRVEKEHYTADKYAGKLTEMFSLELQPVHIKRLGFLVKSYVAGEKDRTAMLTFFQRPANIGGLGLSQEVTEKILAAVDQEKDVLDFVEEEAIPVPELAPAQVPEPPKAPEVTQASVSPPAPLVAPPAPVSPSAPTSQLPEVAPSHEVATSTPVAAGHDLPKPEPVKVTPTLPPAPPKMPAPPKPVVEAKRDDEEIAKHERLIAKKGIAPQTDDAVERAVKSAVDAASATLASKRIAKKAFADVARMTIKGVRDPYQTRSVMEREFGVAGEDLVALLEAIMLGLEEYHAKPTMPVVLSAPIPVDDAVKKAEQEALDKRFAAVAGELPKEKVEPIMPNAQVSAARSKQEEVAEQAAKVDVKKLEEAAAASKPEPAKAMLTVGSVPPPKAGEQSVVTDVQFRPRLVGPVEELGTMSPPDFRRLSSNPVEAAKKIEDILENLEATSYEDRIRGVQAWRKSPIYALYAQMAAEALQEGIALAEVASRRRNKGMESLSPAEMKAVGAVNAKMQF